MGAAYVKCLILVSWTLGTNVSEIFNRNSYIFIHENAFENAIYETSAILSRGDGLSGVVHIIIAGAWQHPWKLVAASLGSEYACTVFIESY